MDAIDAGKLREWAAQEQTGSRAVGDLVPEGTRAMIRERPDRRRSRQLGLEALRAQARQVLVQAGSPDAMVIAQASAGDAAEVAVWCLSDADDDAAGAASVTAQETSVWTISSTGGASKPSTERKTISPPSVSTMIVSPAWNSL